MLLSEYLSGKVNPFTLIDSEVLPLVVGNESKLLTMLLTSYGDKTLYRKFELLTMIELVDMMVLIHSIHWQDLIKFNESEMNTQASIVNTVTETITETGNRETIGESINKVSGYNSDSLIVNDGDNTTQNESNDGETVRTLTNTTSDYMTAYNNLLLSTKANIIKLVIKDISDFLTLDIY